MKLNWPTDNKLIITDNKPYNKTFMPTATIIATIIAWLAALFYQSFRITVYILVADLSLRFMSIPTGLTGCLDFTYYVSGFNCDGKILREKTVVLS